MRSIALIVVLVLSTSGLVAQTCPVTWRQAAQPQPRFGHAAATQTGTATLVLFGGQAGGGQAGGGQAADEHLLGDTWTYAHDCWTLHRTPGPDPRHGHAMAYDAARDTVVLYGGRNESDAFDDTWEWDGNHWSLVSLTGPGPLDDPALVYRPDLEAVMLVSAAGAWTWDGATWSPFAGSAPFGPGQILAAFDATSDSIITFHATSGTTWRLDQQTWQQISAVGPAPRAGAGMAADTERSVIVLHGGNDNGTVFTDTWEWDRHLWRQRSAAGPARSGAAMVVDASGTCRLVGGGRVVQGPTVADLTIRQHTWNGRTWMSPDTLPSRRAEPAITWDSRNHQVVLYGGLAEYPDPDDSDTTWLRSGDAWGVAAGLGNGIVTGHTLVHDPLRDVVVLLGGLYYSDATPVGTWERHDGTWTQVSGAAPFSGEVAAAWHEGLGGVVVTGSDEGDCAAAWLWDGRFWSPLDPLPASDCLEWDLVSDSTRGTVVLFSAGNVFERTLLGWVPVPVSSPAPPFLYRPQVAFDAARDVFVAVGRVGSTVETWTLDRAGIWQQVDVGGLQAATAFDLAYDPVAERVVLAGGRTAQQRLSDVIVEWDGASWIPARGTTPSPRTLPALQHDPSRNETLLFGGDNGVRSAAPEYYDDTWVLRDDKWHAVAGPQPPARSRAATCFRPDTNTILLFGGAGRSGILSDLWEWDGGQWTEVIPDDQPTSPNGAYAQLVWDQRRAAVVCYASDGAYVLQDGQWIGPVGLPFTMAFGSSATFDAGRDAPVVIPTLAYRAWIQEGPDPNDWRQVNQVAPSLWGDLVYSVGRARVLHLGRLSPLSLHSLDAQFDWQAVPIEQPGRYLEEYSVTYDARGGRILLFGGRGTGTFGGVRGDLLALDLGVLIGDLDADGHISLSDLAILLVAFGSGPGGDLNEDGATDLTDLALLLSNFGERCP